MRQKRGLALFLVLSLAGAVTAVAVTGATVADPLVSKGYIDETYLPAQITAGETLVTEHYQTFYSQMESQLLSLTSQYQASLTQEYHASFQDVRVKEGDQIHLEEGCGLIVLAGTGELSSASGRVIDLSTGWEMSTGTLTVQRRYLTTENAMVTVMVTSPTAVISLEGYYSITESQSTDYNALADGLKALGLFQGSDTGYGSGYDLEVAPTRIQGLIMFLRLIGEEDEALSTTESHPFADVADWADPYVAYAYAKGYTNGVEEGVFGSDMTLDAKSYVTFVLRALGYEDSGSSPDFTWETALSQAKSLGVLTAGEVELLTQETFLRAHVAYLSYFCLEAEDANGSTLLSRLLGSGDLDSATVEQVQAQINVLRLT